MLRDAQQLADAIAPRCVRRGRRPTDDPPTCASPAGTSGSRASPRSTRRRPVTRSTGVPCTCGGATTATSRARTRTATTPRPVRRCSTTCRSTRPRCTGCPRPTPVSTSMPPPPSTRASSRPRRAAEDHAALPSFDVCCSASGPTRTWRACSRRCPASTRPLARSSECTAPQAAAAADLAHPAGARRVPRHLARRGRRRQGRRRTPGPVRRRSRAGPQVCAPAVGTARSPSSTRPPQQPCPGPAPPRLALTRERHDEGPTPRRVGAGLRWSAGYLSRSGLREGLVEDGLAVGVAAPLLHVGQVVYSWILGAAGGLSLPSRSGRSAGSRSQGRSPRSNHCAWPLAQ